MTLTFGDGAKNGKSDQVKQLQKVLATLGFSPGTIDGEYGNNTASAVAAFQNAYKINPTGVLDAITFEKMQKAVTGAITLIKPSPVQSITTSLVAPSIFSASIFGIKTSYWLVGLGSVAILYYLIRKPKMNTNDEDFEDLNECDINTEDL